MNNRYDEETIKKLGSEFFSLYADSKDHVESIEKILEQLEIRAI